MSKMQHSSPILMTQWLIEALKVRGLNVKDMLKALDFTAATREAELYSLSFARYLILLNWASEKLGDSALGIHLSKDIRDDAFGSAGLINYYMSSLREAFLSFQQNHALITQAIVIKFIEGPLESEFHYTPLYPAEIGSSQDVELSLSMAVRLIQRVAGKHWQPKRVNFSHGKPPQLDEHLSLLGDNIYFDQPINSFVFESGLLDEKLSDVNPLLLQLLREQIEKLRRNIKRHDDLLARVRYCILVSLGSEAGCDSSIIAKKLHMSRRTLARNLSRQDTNFQAIRFSVIEEIAKQALLQTNSSIVDIALQLGFSEASGFDHCFKRLTGYTPRQYRKDQR